MDDNTFECPNCGAKIYPEMTRCPQCGQSMYPEDEQPSPDDAATGSVGWGSFLGSILVGWLIASGIALLLHFILASLISPAILGPVGKIVIFLAGPLGALVGAYIGSGLARQHSKLLGIVVAVLTLPVLALLDTHWVEVTAGFLLSPSVILTGLFTLIAGILGAWLNEKFLQDGDWKEKLKVRGWEDLLYQDLLRKSRFNGSIADRLIEYERKQDPQANRLKLIQNAIERWERDNR
jgi:hypothetical protein